MEAVVVDNVSKTFRIATDPSDSLKERILRFRRTNYEEFAALRPLDLTIDQGETVGVLGHNGSGKSTLLKCIAGILTPTAGEVRVRGRLASLLELGAGFHHDLTGRENVYMNASFYGMSRRDVDAVFDDIVGFAELAQFIDEPVKHYSSGMYVRLGFAVAVNLDPDVLLVDEVLAVGDEVFQAKCISRIKQFQDEGRTIIFVTHDVETVRQICQRAIVLDHGQMVIDAHPSKSIRVFREYLHAHSPIDDPSSITESPVLFTDVRVRHANERSRRHLLPGESFTVEIDLHAAAPVERPVLAIEVGDPNGTPIFRVDTEDLGTPLRHLDGDHTVHIHVRNVELLDGEYPLNLTLSDRATGRVFDWREGSHQFEVANPTRATGLVALDVSVESDVEVKVDVDVDVEAAPRSPTE
ncbi:MAG: ABC transporter ATP-binding protein [Acidimicrobiia bacterium]|nr:ABC transporter ATP-binding protein [Acidimicrobiia bacterium]